MLRRGNDVWTFTEYGPGASFRLESIALEIRVNDLYEDIELGRLEQNVIDTINRNRG